MYTGNLVLGSLVHTLSGNPMHTVASVTGPSSPLGITMLAAPFGNWWHATITFMYFERNWDASTAIFCRFIGFNDVFNIALEDAFHVMDVLNRARSSMEHKTSDEVQAYRRYAGRTQE